jgi:hypothetical protein
MHTDPCLQARPPQDHAALYDTAKAHAAVLRRQAADAFWAALARRTLQAWRATRRAVTEAARRQPAGQLHCHHGRV